MLCGFRSAPCRHRRLQPPQSALARSVKRTQLGSRRICHCHPRRQRGHLHCLNPWKFLIIVSRSNAVNGEQTPLFLFSPLKVEGLERFVQEASAHVDRRLIDILFNKFDLSKHCDAMRRYVLLGQGDFVQALMDMVRPPHHQREGS